MRIAQISDFHITRMTWNPLRLVSKRLLGVLNFLFTRKGNFSEELLKPLPALFSELKVDLILLGGDFTTTSLHEEFRAAAGFVKRFKEPWIAIPGNHDVYTFASSFRKDFYRYFANKKKTISHPIDLFTLKSQGVEAHKIGPNWWTVALDTCRATNPYSSQGHLPPKQLRYLEEVLNLIPEADSILLFNHYPFFQNDAERRNLQGGPELEALLKKEPRIRLYLHGHTHRYTIADLQPSALPLILDSGSAAQRKQASWNLLDITDTDCTVTPYHYSEGWKSLPSQHILWSKRERSLV